MAPHGHYNSHVMQKVTLVAACWFAFAVPAFGQGNSDAGAQAAAPGSARGKIQTFDIVSIKLHKPGGDNGGIAALPDGLEWRNIHLATLVQGAYGITLESQIAGLPAWAGSDSYDITAKVDAATADRWKKLTPRERWAEELPMIQSILADRCQFKAHQETKEMPVYDLVIAKGGLKMKEALPTESSTEYAGAGKTTVQAMAIDTVVYGFTNAVGRLIVDKTGLGDKKFDFELKWTPDNQPIEDNSADAAPWLFTALQEQLGLKLVSSKGPVQVLVIDHMERPSPN